MVVTVTSDVRVRSKPGTEADSVKYEPLLRAGTMLHIVDGPVASSGYWWYRVELETGILRGGITNGWIAAADRDGTPWIDVLTDVDPAL